MEELLKREQRLKFSHFSCDYDDVNPFNYKERALSLYSCFLHTKVLSSQSVRVGRRPAPQKELGIVDPEMQPRCRRAARRSQGWGRSAQQTQRRFRRTHCLSSHRIHHNWKCRHVKQTESRDDLFIFFTLPVDFPGIVSVSNSWDKLALHAV